MGENLQILLLVITGIALLWIGYSLFFGKASPFYPGFLPWRKKIEYKGKPGEPQICPVCSVKMFKGEIVKTTAFAPDVNAGRIMYIRGCTACLNKKMKRKCPVCHIYLELDDYLISRMFERPNKKNQVRIIGCNTCKKTGKFV